MKIAILSPLGRSDKAQQGGIEIVAKNLAREFIRQGHAVDLLIYPRPGQKPSMGNICSVSNIICLDAPHKRNLVRAVVDYSHQSRPDILLAASYRSNMVACWAKRRLFKSTRIFVSEHNTVSEGVRHDARLKQWYRFRLIRTGYRKADGIIAVSNGVAQDLYHQVGIGEGRIKIIHNPIVTPEMTALAQQPVTHPWLARGQPPVIIGVGRLVRQKDFPTLLHAFVQVHCHRPCRLMILGEGEERSRLLALAQALGIAPDFELPGFTPNVLAYMSRAAVLAFSSAFEGFGNVIAEALAVGTPVVATDCPYGPREILADGLYGSLVPVGDVGALACGIQSALEAIPQPERLRERAQAFTCKEIAAQYLAAFDTGTLVQTVA